MMDYTTACPDWRERIVKGQSLIPFDPLYPDEAEAALEIFKSLRVMDVPGSPTFGECAADWVFDFVAAIFGAYDHETGNRLINDFFLLISKKNTKSTLAAGIMVTALARNWRDENELLILAPTLEVANNAYEPAKSMVDNHERLKKVMHCQNHLRTISYQHSREVVQADGTTKTKTITAKLKVIAADSGTVAGKKAGFILIDEYWLFGKRGDAEAMLAEATGGLISRPEGFVIKLSTHSDQPPAGVFKQQLEYCRDVRDGKIVDKQCLPVMYEWPEDMLESHAYENPDNFYVTNPNIGRSVSKKWLARKLEQKRQDDGDGLQIFLAKHLNVEIGMRLHRDRWRGVDYWEQCADKTLTYETLIARSEVIVAGIDGGGLDDLFALALIGRDRETKKWLVWSKAWVHSDVLETRKSIVPQLREFEKDGDLVILDDGEWTVLDEVDAVNVENGELVAVDGSAKAEEKTQADIEECVEILQAVAATGLFPEEGAIGVDPAGIQDLANRMGSVGLEHPQVVEVRQGYRLGAATWTGERKLKSRTLIHGNQAMLNWCVSNAKVIRRGNSVVVEKTVSGKAKIDPVIAMLNAIHLMGYNPQAVGRSVYERRGAILV